MMRNLIAALALSAAIAMPVSAQPYLDVPIDVDVALVLVVDVSESVDDTEFDLQRQGIFKAFLNPEIEDAIAAGALGRIAVQMIEFSNNASVTIPWTVISGKDSIQAFADQVANHPRSDLGKSTSISAGLTLACNMIKGSGFRATRRVVDVSGDGGNNTDTDGVTMESATALCKSVKVTVNGLPIQAEAPGMAIYYEENVVSGPGNFVLLAEDFEDFARAMRRKLVREIS